MSVTQFELGAIVVKPVLRTFPVTLCVTFSAFFAKIAKVLIVFLVTADAFFGCLFEHRVLVAFFALSFGMLAQQRERRSFMVELG